MAASSLLAVSLAAAASVITSTSPVVTSTVATPAPTAQSAPWEVEFTSSVEARATLEAEEALNIGRPLSTDAPTLQGQETIEQRLRAGGQLRWLRTQGEASQVTLRVEADLFNGPSARQKVAAPTAFDADLADTSQILHADPIYTRGLGFNAPDKNLLRRFSVEYQGRWGRLFAGRTVSKWGLGLLAQDGVEDPFQFGFKRRGTVVDRVQAVVIPAAIPGDGTWAALFPVALSVAADNVVEDDLADVALGETATNMIAAAYIKHSNFEGGVYGVSRSQTDNLGLRIDAMVGDVFARWHERFGKYKVEVATEWLTIGGETTYFRTPSNPNVLKIDQLGGVVRATIQRAKIALRLEAGLASGDQNAYDDTVRNLKFARDYRVGLVLFSDVLRRTTANTANNLADPRFSGQPPTGYTRLATGGAVSQAMYVNPVLRIGPFYGLSAKVGYLMANAPSKLVDVYKTGLAGGTPTGPLGGAASADIGTELDFSVQYRKRFGPVAAIARVDWGCATLGQAFADEDGKVQSELCTMVGQLMARATW